MKNNKNKFVISTLISLISLCYIGMAFSYAWFFSLRSQKNAADNLKIVSFEGEIYEYRENYETEEDGTKTYKGFQDSQTFDDPQADNILSYFEECTTIDFKMLTLLPKTKYLYLLKLRHNMETDINAYFYINSYNSYYGSSDDSQAPFKDENHTVQVSLSEAINIYIYTSTLTEATYADGLNALVNYGDYTTYEKFHSRNNNKTEITSNYATTMDTTESGGGEPLLTKVSIPSSTSDDPYYYVPIMFEFSDKKDTYYSYSYNKDDPTKSYYYHDTAYGTSNVYKNLTFVITEFEVTPYTK